MVDAVVDEGPHPAKGPVALTEGYRRYALGLLVIIYTLNFLDRQIITTIGEPIKADLGLTDTQIGALGGIFFAALYTIIGLPIARLADKGHRPWIMTISLAVWSGFTVLSGMARSYGLLAVARAGVGIGEAGCSPTAHSLLADYFPKDRRAAALGIYSMGISIGTLLGMALGGIIAENYGWRVAFYVAGLPGLLFAVLAILTLKEPRSQLAKDVRAKSNADNHMSMTSVMAALEKRPTFWLFAFGGAFASCVSYAHGQFNAPFFLRNHSPELTVLAGQFGMAPPAGQPPLAFVSTALGILAGFGGAFGAWIGGLLADRWGAKDIRNFALVPVLVPFLSIPMLWVAYTTNNMPLAFLMLIVPNIGVGVWWGPTYGGVQSMVPPAMRALSAAVLLFVINMIGLGVGPTAFGAVSDAFAGARLAADGLDLQTCKTAAAGAAATCGSALAYGVKMAALLSTAILPISMACFFFSRFTVKHDMEHAEDMPERPMSTGKFSLYFAGGFGMPGAFLARALGVDWYLGLAAGALLGVLIALAIVAMEKRRVAPAAV
jgi:MFS family permease